jgi:antitoxin CptB
LVASALGHKILYRRQAAVTPDTADPDLYINHARPRPGFWRYGAVMSDTSGADDELAVRRRKLKFRSWHRGMREMDLIMGRFADACVDAMEPAELDDYEYLMEAPDPELLGWVLGDDPPAPDVDSPMLRRLRAFHRAPRGS